jgi:hypothetical protein
MTRRIWLPVSKIEGYYGENEKNQARTEVVRAVFGVFQGINRKKRNL